MWQPDWRTNTDGTVPVTDGYPRLGTEEEGTTIAYMDSTGTAAVVFEAVDLKGATTLAAAGVAFLASLAF